MSDGCRPDSGTMHPFFIAFLHAVVNISRTIIMTMKRNMMDCSHQLDIHLLLIPWPTRRPWLVGRDVSREKLDEDGDDIDRRTGMAIKTIPDVGDSNHLIDQKEQYPSKLVG